MDRWKQFSTPRRALTQDSAAADRGWCDGFTLYKTLSGRAVKHRSRQERWWAEGGPGYERARERSRSPRSSEVEEVKGDTAAQEEREEEEFRALDLLGDRRPRGEEEIERDLELEEAEEVLPGIRRPVPLEGESQAEAWARKGRSLEVLSDLD